MPNSGLNETAERPIPELPVIGLRQLAYADLPVVISIERRSFTSPWSPGMFVLEMSKGSSITLAAVQDDDRPIAYAVFSRYDAAWHMMNVAVAPEHRRHRIASRLIEGALREIGPGAPVTLEVRPSNRSAIALYETFGFRSYGYRKSYYSNGEDAMIMWLGDPTLAGVPVQAASGG
ncbi:MAG: ribosomal protein S18-alanine N-acetyltransferase [Solirubrobacterales bacterium]